MSSQITFGGDMIFSDLKPGDSVAVNGVCLTVARLKDRTFTADVMHETLNRSNLGTLRQGSSVNLERALAADGRLGGHFVLGHIDGTGVITSLRDDGNARWYTLEAPDSVMLYVVEKGSIAIDGISLTVASVGRGSFLVSVIPHTRSETTLSQRQSGDVVNLEADLLGKYVHKFLTKQQGTSKGLTEEFLLRCGY